MIDEKELAIKGLAMRAGLVPVGNLPKANPQKDVEDFLRRVALCVKQAAESGHKECRFRVNGIPNIPRHVMEAAIEPLKAFGYEARIVREDGVMLPVPPMPLMQLPEIPGETFLVVSGWGD